MSDMNFTLVSHNGHFSGPSYRRELDEAIARRDREQASLQAAVMEQRRQRIEARQLSGPIVAETQEATQFIDQTFDFPRLWADFFDLYTPHGDWWFGGGTSKQDRKHGRMWPFYRNENELNWLRAMSRFVAGWNGGQAGGFLGCIGGYVINKGMTAKAVPIKQTWPQNPADTELVKQVNDVIEQFYDQDLFDRVKFPEYQRHIFNTHCIDGDSYTWTFDLGDHLTLRPVWSELVCQPSGGTFDEWGFGHHTDPNDVMQTLAYHVANMDGTDGHSVVAADMVHIPFCRPGGWTPGIKRGLPLFSFGIKESLDAAGKLERNMTLGEAIRQAIPYIEQQAAMTERSQALEFATNSADVVVSQTVNSSRQIPSIKAVPGYVPKIPQGYEYQPPPSAQTSQAIEVIDCALRSAGSVFSAPGWAMNTSGKDQGAYEADLVKGSPFRNALEMTQEFIGARLMPILYKVVQIAIRNGILPPDTLRRVRLTMEHPTITVENKGDPVNENKEYLDRKIKSPQQVQQELSLDPDKQRHEIEEFAAWVKKSMPQSPIPGDQPNAPKIGQQPGNDQQQRQDGNGAG